MALLVDTHLAIWLIGGSKRLTPSTRQRLLETSSPVYVSAAAIWEIAIKWRLQHRRGPVPFSGSEALERFAAAGLHLLPISAHHAAATEALPPPHADPFDRLMLAQARTEGMTLLTADATLLRYGPGVELA